jgi:hypothetical protein
VDPRTQNCDANGQSRSAEREKVVNPVESVKVQARVRPERPKVVLVVTTLTETTDKWLYAKEIVEEEVPLVGVTITCHTSF